MLDLLALFGGVAAFALLVVGIAAVSRKMFLARQVAFPLIVGAGAAAFQTYLWIVPTPSPAAVSLRNWLLAFLLIAVVLRLVGLYLFDVHLPARRGLRLPTMLPTVTMLVVYVIAALFTLRLTFPKLDIAPLLATSAVTSLVLGLALQPILGNFFAGLVISAERPYRINDWIKVGEDEGRVVAINWRTTHLRTRNNDDIVLPNGRMADERILNYYYPHTMHMMRTVIGAHYDTPPYRVRRTLLESAHATRGVLENPAPEVYLLDFADSAILYEVRIFVDDVAQGPRIQSDLRYRIWEDMRREGIEIPYPMRTIHLAPRARKADAASEPPGPPPARLFVADGADRGKSISLGGVPATVGRSRSCSLSLAEVNASKEHLRIEWTDDGYRLTDLGSSYGTRVNGTAATSALLRPFDRIAIGETVLVFEVDRA
ncbi:MAG TPA: mechanosensitive ion channel domain-containing protein [Thermoanaerobaculia bacterium]|jgi:small-conductance mechanosensitive channel|nr:mechanosensitive ion channel domain-containing protein [Thermoanaerobaculia bacterium]